ncbi:oxidoreductase-like domain-containing protein [Myxococcota bacterium]|nr:oxidoreductase-like domain-containing protein [Myxococcota bacterium]
MSQRPSPEQHATLRELAAERDLPKPPRRPVDGECCERGCGLCIWDVYLISLRRWVTEHGFESVLEPSDKEPSE